MTSSCTAPLFVVNISHSFGEFTAPLRHILPSHNVATTSNNLFVNFHWTFNLRWEIEWRNAPRIWRDFGSALPFQTRLTQTKPVLPLSNEQGSQVKDQGRWQCCHNKHKNFHIGLHVMYLYFPDTPRTMRPFGTKPTFRVLPRSKYMLCSNSALYTNSLLCFVLYAMLGILGLQPDSQLSFTNIWLAALDLTSAWRYLSYRRVDCGNIIASEFYDTRI